MRYPYLGRALLLASGLVTLTASSAAEVLTPRRATPSPEARERGRGPTQPPRLGVSKGFGSAISPYRDVMSEADTRLFVRTSEELVTSSFARALAESGVKIARSRRQDLQSMGLQEPDLLFTYEIPNDPSLRLGLAKSRDGKVTAPPRLVSGLLDTKGAQVDKSPQAAAGAATLGLGLSGLPEQVCTANLAYSLTPTGSGAFAMEYLPPDIPVSVYFLNMLTEIEAYPNPILKGEAGARAAGVDTTGSKPNAEMSQGDGAANSTAESDLQDIIVEMSEGPSPGSNESPLFRKIASGAEVSFVDYATWLTKENVSYGAFNPHTPSQTVLKSFLAIADLLTGLKTRCIAAGNTWTEVKILAGNSLNLFGCFRPDGKKQVGLGARAAASSEQHVSEISLFVEDLDQGGGAELNLDFENGSFQLRSYKNGGYLGPRLIYELTGAPTALEFAVPDARRGDGGEYEVYEWHEGGQIKLVGRRKGGVPIGEERSYYESGTLAGVVKYDPSGLVTSYREWFENQIPAEDTSLQDGQMHGVRRWWHPNGHQAGELAYSSGLPDGPLRLWYDGGKIGVTTSYKQGLLDGDVRWSYDDGGALFVGNYKADRPDGAQRLLLPNGVVISERSFKEGNPDGAWMTYNADGKPAREFAFKGGVKEGRTQFKYPSGQVALDMVWKGGEIEGPLSSYYPDGQLAATCFYEKDNLVAFTRLLPTGETQLEGKIVDVEKGKGSFAALRKDGSRTLECTLADFQIATCHAFSASGEDLALPGYSQLTRNIKQEPPPPTLPGQPAPQPVRPRRWAPDQCGGYDTHIDYEAVINGSSSDIFVTYSTKDECKGPGLGMSLRCPIKLQSKTTEQGEACVVSGWSIDEALEALEQERDGVTTPSHEKTL